MLNVALSFDYELFFGENYGTADEILFDPTNQLLDTLDKYQAKATFFADVLSVYMHEKYGLTDYCQKFKNQIADMVARGHDVQLHIHSNWLKSTWKDGKWDFDIASYRIHTFGFDDDAEWSVGKIIRWGKQFLEETLQAVNPSYRCVAYRAGGYSIQPHAELFRVLLENGIYIDSSVAMLQEAHNVNEYDYKDIPDRNGWWIGLDSPINEPTKKKSGAVYEIPVAYYKPSLIKRLFKPKEERVIPHKLKGSYIKMPSSGSSSAVAQRSKLRMLLNYNKTPRILAFDSIHYQSIIQTLKKREKRCRSPYQTIAVIGHPKIIDALWLKNMDNFLAQIRNEKKLNLIPICNMYSLCVGEADL